MREILEECPACEQDMIVTEQSCLHCGTTVRGQFQPNLFSKLSPELGWSYWTIRNHLNEVISELGFEDTLADEQFEARERQDILAQLDRGEINAAEAAELLAKLEDS